jgi:hypothetical protein
MNTELRSWFVNCAKLSDKKFEVAAKICDDELIDSVRDLADLNREGSLTGIFPQHGLRVSIQRALLEATSQVEEAKDELIKAGQDTLEADMPGKCTDGKPKCVVENGESKCAFESASTTIAVSAIAADGSTYALGQLQLTDTVFTVKQKLAELSEMRIVVQSMYLIEETRGGDEDLALKNATTIGEVKNFAASTTAGLQFAVMVGLQNNNIVEFLNDFAVSVEPTIVIGDNTNPVMAIGANYTPEEPNPAPRSVMGVSFVPEYPELVVASVCPTFRVGDGSEGLALQEQLRVYNKETNECLCMHGGYKGIWGLAVTADSAHVVVAENGEARVQVCGTQ